MEELTNKSSFKSYLFFWSGQLVSVFGSSVVSFVLIWWLVDETGSPVVLSIGTVSYFVPYVLGSLISGVVADRYNRKKVIFIADSLQAFATFIIILYFAFDIMEYWHFYFFNASRSICQAFHQPTQNSIIPTMVPKDKLSRINGISFLLTGVIRVMGPMTGGTLLLFLTVEQALWIDIITYLISIIPLLLIKIPSFHKKTEDQKHVSIWKEFKSGFKILVTIPGLLALILQAMIWNFFIQPLYSLLPYYITVIHNGTVVDFAVFSISFNIGLFIGGIITLIKKEWKNKVPIIIIATIIHAIVYVLFSFVPIGFFFLIMLYSTIRGLTMPIINTLYFTIMQMRVPPDKLGRITSLDNILSFISIPLGNILVGPLTLIIGIESIFLINAYIIITVQIIFYFFTKIELLDSKKEFDNSHKILTN